MIRSISLERALPAIVGFITSRTGIPVLRGTQACTNGDVVFIPRLPDLALSMRDVVRVIGYIYHECFHVLWTNFQLDMRSLPPIQQGFIRVLEDIRIEHKGITRFPAARKYLAQLVQIFTEDGQAGLFPSFLPLDEEQPDGKLLQFFMLYKLRHDLLRQEAIFPALEPTESVVRGKFPPNMLVRLEALMFQVADCESTDDVLELAASMASMIEEEKRQEEERQQQEQAQQQNDGQDQSNDSAVSDAADQQQQGSGDQDQSNDSGADDAGPEAGMDDGDVKASATDNGDQQIGGDDSSASAAGANAPQSSVPGGTPALDAMGAALSMGEEDLIQTIDEMLEGLINQTAVELEGKGTSMPNVHKLQLPSKAVDVAALRSSVNAVRTKTLQWLSSQAESDLMHTRQGVHLDFTRLHEARRGGAIFVRSDEGIDYNAAIQIVIDRSGSMRDEIGLAAQAAVATMLAFDVPGINTQVSVFPAYGKTAQDDHDEGVAVVKHWDESPGKLAGRIAAMDVAGSTPMAEAVLFAAADLVHRPETLKMIVVVTDGDPDDRAATMQVIRTARESGIAVMGLGIGVDPTDVFGPRFAAPLHDVKELSGAMIRLIKSSLLH